MTAKPVVDVLSNGEKIQFNRRGAAALVYKDNATTTLSDDGKTITVETTDHTGTPLVLTYKLNQVLVEVAEYDIADKDVEFTTEPSTTEDLQVYGNPEDVDDASVHLDGREITQDSDNFEPIYTHADDIEAEEDFFAAMGLDESHDPIPNQYRANWILVMATYKNTDGEPFYTHPKYNPETDSATHS